MQATVGGQFWSLGEALDAVDTVGQVVGLFGQHSQLSSQCPITQQERRGLGAPGLEVVFGVLNENICMKRVSLSL